MSETIVDEYSSPISVERLWRAGICDFKNLMPKLLPQVLTSIEFLGGDGGVGTIQQYKFIKG